MNVTINEAIIFEDFGLTSDDISWLNDKTLVVTKWNWDYSLAHKFQKSALKVVQDTPDLRILICCNHPEVLTNGRGLQKARKGEVLDLIDFDSKEFKNLPYPIHQIERGGGLTFHHPGQFIFYPITKLNPKTLSLSIMINQIFDFSAEILKDWGISELSHENKLLGLWSGEKKIASMGIAIEKLTTFHGMALNINENKNMMSSLESLNPCGLKTNRYTTVESLVTLPENPIHRFKTSFLERIHDEWK